MPMLNSPATWDYLLNNSPKGSVLMGGAVVDYMFQKEAKDFDIFYTYQHGVAPKVPWNWKLTDQNFNDPEWVKKNQEAYMQGADENGFYPIASVHEYLVDGVYKVQLIGVMYEDPSQHFKNFDHSLTLGKYTTKKGLFVHSKVFESYDTDTILYVSKNKDKDAVDKSYARAVKKAAKYKPHVIWNYKGFIAQPQEDFAL